MGRRYYRNYRRRESYSDEIDPKKAGGLFLFFAGLGFWYTYEGAIYNFLNQYGITLVVMIILIFIAVIVVKREIKPKKQYNQENSIYNPVDTNQIRFDTSSSENSISLDNDEIDDNKEELKNIRDINMFLKRQFRYVFANYEIYGISGFLRWLHPKAFEDLIELMFKLKGFEIINKSTRKQIYGSRRIAQKDGGIDLICKKNDKLSFIQIKGTVNDFVTDDVIRNLHGSTINERKPGDDVIVITTTLFSKEAKKTAGEDNIRLIEFDELNESIDMLYKNENYRETLQDFFIKKAFPMEEKYLDYLKECPDCGAPLKYRKNCNGRKPCYGCLAFCGYIKFL